MLELMKKMQVNLTDKKLILNAPDYYLNQLTEANISFDTDVEEDSYDFIQVFGIANEEIMQWTSMYIDFLTPDGAIWLCFPHKNSKSYPNSVCTKQTVADLLVDYDFYSGEEVTVNEDFASLKFTYQK